MYPYKLIITQEETSEGLIFVAKYPAFKYVSGGGHTIDEAVTDLNEAISIAIEYMVKEGISIPTPDIELKDFSGKLVLRLSKTLHKEISEQASEENVSLNTYMIEALTAYVNRGKAIVKSLTVNED